MKQQKVKLSRKLFAEALYYQWLAPRLTEEAVKETAKDLGVNIRNDKHLIKIFQELCILDMWLIVHTCAGIIEDEDKRNECLDIFHQLVYDHHIQKEEKGFNDWMRAVAPIYVEYNKAMETEHPSTPLWVVANVFNKRLFGEVWEDLEFQLKLITRIGLSMKYLAEAIKQYDIE